MECELARGAGRGDSDSSSIIKLGRIVELTLVVPTPSQLAIHILHRLFEMRDSTRRYVVLASAVVVALARCVLVPRYCGDVPC